MAIELNELATRWEVIINRLPYHKTEVKKGRVIIWGRDGNIMKINQVYYPKLFYSKERVQQLIKDYYQNCPMCYIGKSINNFKYQKSEYKIMSSLIDLLGKIPKLGDWITRNRRQSEEWLMQSLATLIRNPIQMSTTTFGSKIISLIVGLGGSAGVSYLLKGYPNLQNELLTFFANWGSNTLDPTPEQINEMARDIRKLKDAIRFGDFYGVADAIFRAPAGVEASVRNLANAVSPKLGNVGMEFQSFVNNIPDPLGLKSKLRFRQVPVTHTPFTPSHSAGGRLGVGVADDYQYIDSSKRFRRSDVFGKGFFNERKFRQSGIDRYPR